MLSGKPRTGTKHDIPRFIHNARISLSTVYIFLSDVAPAAADAAPHACMFYMESTSWSLFENVCFSYEAVMSIYCQLLCIVQVEYQQSDNDYKHSEY